MRLTRANSRLNNAVGEMPAEAIKQHRGRRRAADFGRIMMEFFFIFFCDSLTNKSIQFARVKVESSHEEFQHCAEC